jgi:uncharacterized protein YraI
LRRRRTERQASLGNWDSFDPYGVSSCNAGSMATGTTSTNATPSSRRRMTTGGLPIINPACDVATSYMRSQPTRILYAHGDLPLPKLQHQEPLR